MDEFTVCCKISLSVAHLDHGSDSNRVPVPSAFNHQAADFVASVDGRHTYQFLFWNMGRPRVTETTIGGRS